MNDDLLWRAFGHVCGPTELGGQGDTLREWTEGKAHDLEELQRPVNGSIVSIPGMPKLLDRDLYPQDLGEKQHKVVQALVAMSKHHWLDPTDQLSRDIPREPNDFIRARNMPILSSCLQ
jgi:hypothetical protein